jgi:hypothetical protein
LQKLKDNLAWASKTVEELQPVVKMLTAAITDIATVKQGYADKREEYLNQQKHYCCFYEAAAKRIPPQSKDEGQCARGKIDDVIAAIEADISAAKAELDAKNAELAEKDALEKAAGAAYDKVKAKVTQINDLLALMKGLETQATAAEKAGNRALAFVYLLDLWAQLVNLKEEGIPTVATYECELVEAQVVHKDASQAVAAVKAEIDALKKQIVELEDALKKKNADRVAEITQVIASGECKGGGGSSAY